MGCSPVILRPCVQRLDCLWVCSCCLLGSFVFPLHTLGEFLPCAGLGMLKSPRPQRTFPPESTLPSSSGDTGWWAVCLIKAVLSWARSDLHLGRTVYCWSLFSVTSRCSEQWLLPGQSLNSHPRRTGAQAGEGFVSVPLIPLPGFSSIAFIYLFLKNFYKKTSIYCSCRKDLEL